MLAAFEMRAVSVFVFHDFIEMKVFFKCRALKPTASVCFSDGELSFSEASRFNYYCVLEMSVNADV